MLKNDCSMVLKEEWLDSAPCSPRIPAQLSTPPATEEHALPRNAFLGALWRLGNANDSMP